MRLELVVNGRGVAVEVPADRRLLDVLRDDLGLTGAKEGCGLGECGACTVLLDGEPALACLIPAFQVHGARVTTVEGLGTPQAPAPIQAALVAEGAVQCGYCTPGFAVSASHLLHQCPAPSRHDLREALAGNLCRCTGYTRIEAAVERAAAGPVPLETGADRVGESPARVDALDKATGACRYTADLPAPPGCLHGATVRVWTPHARLVRVDTAAAEALPGVARVLTAADVPGARTWGNALEDQPVFAWDRVRFAGEAVAVVLAEDEDTARRGAALVRVLTEDLPVVCDPAAALGDDAVHLHEGGNLLVHQHLRKGDATAALAGAEVVLERSYTTVAQEHVCLEPEVALALPEADGGVTVRAPSQNVFFDRHHLCRILDLPPRRVRVVQEPTGAAFGSREDLYAQHHAALGAVLTSRPVRIAWTREESQVATVKRHPAAVRLRAGVTSAGDFVALEAEVLADTGAYASWAPNVARKMLVHAAGPYAWPAVAVDVRMASTNNGVAGAFRGFGAPQVAFAVECLVDEVAAELGLDPVALRRRNHLAVGSTTATGQTITGSCGLTECLDRALDAAEAPLPPPDPGWVRGRGVATVHYGIGYGNAIGDIGSAIAELTPAGVTLRCGAIDYGQGALTVFTQIAAEVLGISRAALTLVTGDTDHSPNSGSTVASRQTYVSGEAVRQAAERLRATLLDAGAAAWDLPREALSLCDSGLARDGEPVAPWSELVTAVQETGGRTRRQARFKARTTALDPDTGQGDAYWPYAWAAHVADVDVHRATGRVRVARVVAAHDVGRAIHPVMVAGQIEGGVVQGLGMALWEWHRLHEGRPLTRNLDGYRLPGIADTPEIVPLIVEDPEPTGPFGAKGVGEPTLVAVVPAVANAVAAAGARCRDLPLLPERVLDALEGRETLAPKPRPRRRAGPGWRTPGRVPEVMRPATFGEAARALHDLGLRGRVIAGGTDLMVALRHGRPPQVWVDLSEVAQGRDIYQLDGYLVVGALVTHARLARSPLVQRALPALWDAAHAMGSPQIRARGTLGGNLANGSPAADMAPPLLVGDAEVRVVSATERRWMAVRDLFVGPGATVLAHDELISGARVPLRDGTWSAFARLGGRERHVISKASVAVAAHQEAGALRQVRVALGAVAPTPIRSPATEAALEGRSPDDADALALAAAGLARDAAPIDDLRSTAAYRERALGALLADLLARAQ